MQIFKKFKVFIKAHLLRLAKSYCCHKCNHLTKRTISEKLHLDTPKLLTEEISLANDRLDNEFLSSAIIDRERIDLLIKRELNSNKSDYEDILFDILKTNKK